MVLFEDFIMKELENNKESFMYKLFYSGARLKSVQLLRGASNTGIPTDIYGKAFKVNIQNSLLDGQTPEQYFQSGDSARLALSQRQDAIPKGGELQRKFYFATGILKLDDVEDCHSLLSDEEKENKHLYTTLYVKSKDHLKLLKYRFYLDPETGEEKEITGNEDFLINQEIKLRSPITCQLPGFKICKKCFGKKLPTSKNLGSLIGSVLPESIIQSILRTHHFSGAFLSNIDQK
jgi:hypothetical protein